MTDEIRCLENHGDFEQDLEDCAYELASDNEQRQANGFIAAYANTVLQETHPETAKKYMIATTQHNEAVVFMDKKTGDVYGRNNDGLKAVEQAYFGANGPNKGEVEQALKSTILSRVRRLVNE